MPCNPACSNYAEGPVESSSMPHFSTEIPWRPTPSWEHIGRVARTHYDQQGVELRLLSSVTIDALCAKKSLSLPALCDVKYCILHNLLMLKCILLSGSTRQSNPGHLEPHFMTSARSVGSDVSETQWPGIPESVG